MKKVLVCPLDWGLGHATRCIPVIRELEKQGAEVLLASSGEAGLILMGEFPTNSYFELPSNDPKYATNGSMMLKMMLQLPKFIRVRNSEHRIIEELVRKYTIDIVISDNRYGCYSATASSIFISHQPGILMPKGWSFMKQFVDAFSLRQIRKFQEVWIPDKKGSGLTSPFGTETVPSGKYIGWLSRFHFEDIAEQEYELIGIVSGPEPQRTIFADKLLIELIHEI